MSARLASRAARSGSSADAICACEAAAADVAPAFSYSDGRNFDEDTERLSVVNPGEVRSVEERILDPAPRPEYWDDTVDGVWACFDLPMMGGGTPRLGRRGCSIMEDVIGIQSSPAPTRPRPPSASWRADASSESNVARRRRPSASTRASSARTSLELDSLPELSPLRWGVRRWKADGGAAIDACADPVEKSEEGRLSTAVNVWFVMAERDVRVDRTDGLNVLPSVSLRFENPMGTAREDRPEMESRPGKELPDNTDDWSLACRRGLSKG